MPETRRHARVRPATRSGKIIVDPKKPAIDCSVVDVSAGGACLEVSDPAALPRRFELLHGGIRKKCSVAWRTRFRLGVSF